MRVSKNWVKFNKMFTLSPWDGGDQITDFSVRSTQEASICEIKRMKEQMEQFARIVRII